MVGVLVAGLLIGGLWWVGSRVSSPEQRAAEAAAPVASPIGVPVEFRVLADTIITRGDVKPSGAVDVVWSGGSGVGASAGIVTATPVPVGGQVAEGQPVIEVAGRPVFLLAGSLPIYRDLSPGSAGDDVAQLQEILARLGFDPGEHDGVFGAGTKAAVEAWYRAEGYEPALTSKDAAAQLTAAAGALTEAQDALTAAQVSLLRASAGSSNADRLDAETALASARRALDDARVAQSAQTVQAQAELDAATATYDRLRSDPTADPADVQAAKVGVVSAQAAFDQTRASAATATANAADAVKVAEARLIEIVKPPDASEAQAAVDAASRAVVTAQAAFDELSRVSGVMVSASELVVIGQAPASVAALNVAVGAKAEGTLATLTSSGLIVESLLDASAAQLVRPGAPVTLDSELAGTTVTGVLTSVAAEPVIPSEQNGGRSGYPAIITTDVPLGPEWLGRNLRVTVTNAATDTESLVVPEAAVYARADGTTRVTKLDTMTGQQTDVEVTVGLTAGGFAAITPVVADGVKPGDLVVVGAAPTAATAPTGAP